MVQPTLDVIDANLAPVTIYTINPNGRSAAAGSQGVALSTEDKTSLDLISSTLVGGISVTGTFWQATQPVSGTVSIAAGAAVIGHVITDAGSTTAVTGTVAISAVSLPLPTGAATETTSVSIASNIASSNIILGDIETNTAGTITAVAATTTAVNTVNTTLSNGITVHTDGGVDTVNLADGTSTIILSPTGADASANGVARLPVLSATMGYNGATWDRIRGTVADGLLVNLGANNDVTISGTVPLPTGAATETTLAALNTKINTKALNVQVVGADVGLITHSVLHGLTTAGGGSYVDVKVNPSGALTVEVTGDKTNNAAAPGATNVGALVGVANAAAPTQVEGRLVALRTTLSGDLAITLDSESVAVTNAALSVVGNGAAATAQRVTLANDSTGIVSLTTSTASIGKLAANSGIDIGDVDVTSIIPGTGATNLGKAIDTATGATDTGVLALFTRDDALTTVTPIDGDNAQGRVNARGALWISIDNGSGSQVTSFGGGTQYVEDSAHVGGDLGFGALQVRSDTPASTAGTTGDYVLATQNSAGYQRVEQAGSFCYNDSTSNQTNGTTLTGTARDVGYAVGNIYPWSYFNFTVFNSHASTIRIEMSNDSSTYRAATADISVLAGVPQTISVPVVTRYYRIINVQGGSTSTAFMANSGFSNN